MREFGSPSGDHFVAGPPKRSMFDDNEPGAGIALEIFASAPVESANPLQPPDSQNGLRALLAEARASLDEMERARTGFARFVDEAASSLSDVEEEQARNISLSRMLGEARANLALQQDKVQKLENRIADCERDIELLRCELDARQVANQQLTLEKAALTTELEQRRAAAAQRSNDFVEAIKARAAASLAVAARPPVMLGPPTPAAPVFGPPAPAAAAAPAPVMAQAVAPIPAPVAEAPLRKLDAAAEAGLRDLKSALHQERLDRAYAEGALEAQRLETAQLHRELMKLRGEAKSADSREARSGEGRTGDSRSSEPRGREHDGDAVRLFDEPPSGRGNQAA